MWSENQATWFITWTDWEREATWTSEERHRKHFTKTSILFPKQFSKLGTEACFFTWWREPAIHLRRKMGHFPVETTHRMWVPHTADWNIKRLNCFEKECVSWTIKSMPTLGHSRPPPKHWPKRKESIGANRPGAQICTASEFVIARKWKPPSTNTEWVARLLSTPSVGHYSVMDEKTHRCVLQSWWSSKSSHWVRKPDKEEEYIMCYSMDIEFQRKPYVTCSDRKQAAGFQVVVEDRGGDFLNVSSSL